MALLHACAFLHRRGEIRARAVSVDHGLQAETAEVAHRVAATADSWGMPAEVVPVDIKTGRSAVTRAEAAVHPQLALYQLAVARGAVTSAGDRGPGGGLLLYVAGREGRPPTERVQDPLGTEAADALTDRIVEAGRSTVGPEYTARVGAWCEHCDVRSSCPAQPQGEQVIG